MSAGSFLKNMRALFLAKSFHPLQRLLGVAFWLGLVLSSQLQTIKKRYNDMDTRTKRRVVAGIASVTALIAGGMVARRWSEKKHQR